MSAVSSVKILAVDTDAKYDRHLKEHGVNRDVFLGKGTYGTVCRSSNGVVKLQSPKRYHESVLDQLGHFKCALQEAYIQCDLSNRNISVVPKVEWAVIGDMRVAIGMERSGRDILTKYLRANKFPRLARLKMLSNRWIIGLDEIHKAGVIHCDLKPTNITDMHVLDYGISQRVGSVNQEVLICSRWYRAPEVILGLPYTRKLDLFSLGAVLFEIYTGSPLFLVDEQKSQSLTDIQHLYHFLDVMEQDKFPRSLMEKALFYCSLDESTQQRFLRPIDENNRINKPKTFAERMLNSKEFFQDKDREYNLWIDLLNGLLEFDPEKRLSAEEALKHPFFEIELEAKVEKEECKEAPLEQVEPLLCEFVSKFATLNPFAPLMDEKNRV